MLAVIGLRTGRDLEAAVGEQTAAPEPELVRSRPSASAILVTRKVDTGESVLSAGIDYRGACSAKGDGRLLRR